MTEIRKVVRALPNLQLLQMLLERMEAGFVEGVQKDEARELKIAIHLIHSIEFEVEEKKGNVPDKFLHCSQCNREIALPTPPAIRTTALCIRCTVWKNLAGWSAANPEEVSLTSLRFGGSHYACITDVAMDGELVTIQLPMGRTIVTPSLRYQGPVPPKYAQDLPDNCVLIKGNPLGFPLGISDGPPPQRTK